MREYLFRGKAKCNGEWVYGAYCPYNWNYCGERKVNPHKVWKKADRRKRVRK